MTEAANGVPSFSLGHLNIRDKTARYNLSVVWPGAWIEGRPAVPDLNPTYREGLLAQRDRAGDVMRSVATGQPEKASSENAEQRADVDLFADCVITNWSGIVDSEGKPAPFSKEGVRKLLGQLLDQAPWLFGRLTLFFKLPDSFIERAKLPPKDVEGVAKN